MRTKVVQPSLFGDCGCSTVKGGARFSPCRLYRYLLTRTWGDGPIQTWMGLNPSDANEDTDDPTVTRLCVRARSDGYAGISLVNLYAWCSPNPKVMLRANDPVGPENDQIIQNVCRSGVVCAWGANARPERCQAVLALLHGIPLYHLGLTKDGHPKHPLYLPYRIEAAVMDSTPFDVTGVFSRAVLDRLPGGYMAATLRAAALPKDRPPPDLSSVDHPDLLPKQELVRRDPSLPHSAAGWLTTDLDSARVRKAGQWVRRHPDAPVEAESRAARAPVAARGRDPRLRNLGRGPALYRAGAPLAAAALLDLRTA